MKIFVKIIFQVLLKFNLSHNSNYVEIALVYTTLICNLCDMWVLCLRWGGGVVLILSSFERKRNLVFRLSRYSFILSLLTVLAFSNFSLFVSGNQAAASQIVSVITESQSSGGNVTTTAKLLSTNTKTGVSKVLNSNFASIVGPGVAGPANPTIIVRSLSFDPTTNEIHVKITKSAVGFSSLSVVTIDSETGQVLREVTPNGIGVGLSDSVYDLDNSLPDGVQSDATSLQRNSQRTQRNTEQIGRNTEQIGRNTEQIGRNTEQIEHNTQGVAMAIALGGGGQLGPSENGAVSVDYGTFQGRSALAVNGGVRLSSKLTATGGVGVGLNDNLVGGRAGLRFAW